MYVWGKIIVMKPCSSTVAKSNGFVAASDVKYEVQIVYSLWVTLLFNIYFFSIIFISDCTLINEL